MNSSNLSPKNRVIASIGDALSVSKKETHLWDLSFDIVLFDMNNGFSWLCDLYIYIYIYIYIYVCMYVYYYGEPLWDGN